MLPVVARYIPYDNGWMYKSNLYISLWLVEVISLRAM